ncbi:phosphoglycerate kinase, partial [Escherichia coli]|nr:phosphoglycerate kinase [Escherichia coli]
AVFFSDDCVGPKRAEAVKSLRGGQVLLLENLRFHPEEEKNDAEFAKRLAEGIDIYVNDAFGTAHRAHASTEGITHFVSPCVA